MGNLATARTPCGDSAADTSVESKQDHQDRTTSLDVAAAGLVGMVSRFDAVPAAKRFWHRRSIRSTRPTTTTQKSRP